jgi:hypothetical protein
MNEIANEIVAFAVGIGVLAILWKYSQMWAVAVATKIIRVYFQEKAATSAK